MWRRFIDFSFLLLRGYLMRFSDGLECIYRWVVEWDGDSFDVFGWIVGGFWLV